MTEAEIAKAVDLAGDWEAAHAIVQVDETGRFAGQVHAVLHQSEGDTPDARQWSRLAGQFFESSEDPKAELVAITAALSKPFEFATVLRPARWG